MSERVFPARSLPLDSLQLRCVDRRDGQVRLGGSAHSRRRPEAFLKRRSTAVIVPRTHCPSTRFMVVLNCHAHIFDESVCTMRPPCTCRNFELCQNSFHTCYIASFPNCTNFRIISAPGLGARLDRRHRHSVTMQARLQTAGAIAESRKPDRSNGDGGVFRLGTKLVLTNSR